MNINLLSLNQRSACFELNQGAKYAHHGPLSYRVFLNDIFVLSDVRNVFSVHGLTPSTGYRLRVERIDGHTAHCDIKTPSESLVINARDYCAAGEGDMTGALQAAIDACPAGGTVFVPAGVYPVYPLFLHDDMLLYLDNGARLLGGTDRARYPVLPGMAKDKDGREYPGASWEGNALDSYASLITVLGARNVTIAGPGTIDANAQNADWWLNPKVLRGAWRPRTIFASHAERLTILGVQIRNSPSWTVHPYYSRHVDVLDVTITNPPSSPNTDGCNPESSEHVRVIGADISVGDDCIAIKSGKYSMAARHFQPSRDILVRNCLLRRGHGAVVVGSEIASGVYDLVIEQCLMCDTDRGLRIKTRRGRGRDSIVAHIVMRDVLMQRVLAPFVVNMLYCCDSDDPDEPARGGSAEQLRDLTPEVRDIRLTNVDCREVEQCGVFAGGLPDSPIGSIEMETVSFSFAEAARPGLPAMMDGLMPTKKRALIATHVKRLTLDDVRFDGYDGEKYALDDVQMKEVAPGETGRGHGAHEALHR